MGRIFTQSEPENTVSETNMHDTRTVIDTRRCQTNKSRIKTNDYTLQPLIDNTIVNYSTINNNNNNECKIFPIRLTTALPLGRI